MCMWQEKLELTDGIQVVKGFDDWILKYQIAEPSINDPALKVSMLGLGAEILSENIRHTES